MAFIPDNYKLTFNLVEVKKTFEQYQLQTAAKTDLLPEIIRLEKNNGFNSITGADNLLRVRNAPNWTKCSLAGLRPTETPNFYYSDLPVKGVKSLIVVHIPPDRQTVLIRVCRAFYPVTPDGRTRIINDIIKNF